MQWVVIGPENGDDVSPCTHHIRHRLRWWMEPGAGPGGKRARGYRGRAPPCRRRDCAGAGGWASDLGWWLSGTRCVTGGAPGCWQYYEQDQRCAPPHVPTVHSTARCATRCMPSCSAEGRVKGGRQWSQTPPEAGAQSVPDGSFDPFSRPASASRVDARGAPRFHQHPPSQASMQPSRPSWPVSLEEEGTSLSSS